jgi:ABC-type Zn uptake system ZnuABC Zn-binding protein ZnuA
MSRNSKKTIWSVLILTFLLVGCGRREEEKPDSAIKKLNVVTTVAPITSMVDNIAGDKIGLTGIIPEGNNSHTFEPVP